MDAPLDGYDLCCDGFALARKNNKAEARGQRNPIVRRVGNDLEQLGSTIAAFRRDNAELCHMPADRIRQHRSLTNEKLPAAMQHQARLLLFRLVGTKRIDGRVTASQIAAASLASFLLRLR